MANFRGIIFDGVQNPSFMRVKSISHSALPPITLNTVSVPGRAGDVDTDKDTLGIRYISMNIQVLSEEKNMLPKKLELLSKWLLKPTAKELILGDNPDRVYYAKLDGDTTFSEILRMGEGTLVFACTDPYIYTVGERIINLPNFSTQDTVSIMNNGNASTSPIVELEIADQASCFGVVANNEFIEFGLPTSIDDLVVPWDPIVLNDACRTTSGWTKAQGIHGGNVTDQEISVQDNEVFIPSGGKINETEIQGWYGPSMYKQLKSEVTDFSGAFTFDFLKGEGKTSTPEERTNGKIIFVLKDTNNKDIAVVKIYDNEEQRDAIRLEFGLINSNISTRWIFTNYVVPAKYNNLYGTVFIERKNDVWSCRIDANNKGNAITLVSGRYADSKKEYASKIKFFQFGFQKWKKKIDNKMEFTHVNIKSLDVPKDKENSPQIIVTLGDKIRIDNKTGKIFKNDSLWLENLNPSSSFIKLESGLNDLSVYPPGIISGGKVKFRERY